jgi:serine/threonine protein kinase
MSKRNELNPSDFFFGACLGEGAYARVVHAKLKSNNNEFAVKIMEKKHIAKENKVSSTFLFLFPIVFNSQG